MPESVTVDQTDLATILLWVTVSGPPSSVTKAAKRLREELKLVGDIKQVEEL